MGGSNFFREQERDVLSGYIERWRKLKLNPDEDHVKGERKPKDKLIDAICDVFFTQFTDRDPYLTDPSPVTLTHAQMKAFPKTVRQWLNNQTKDTPTVSKRGKNRVKRSNKTARHLAQSRYSDRIEAQAKVLVAENPGTHMLKARNLATTACIEQLRNDCSAEWHELEQLALDIRSSSNKDHADQRPEVLQSILTSFPKQLYKETEQWSRTMGVLMHTVLVLSTPDDATLKSFVVSSPRLHAFEDSPAGEGVRDTVVEWIRDNLGGPVDQSDEPSPTIYPNKGNLKPMLPVAENPESCDRLMLRGWIRLYLTYLWKWLGGHGPVPWKRIARAGAWDYVPEGCLPPGVERLTDPHSWQREEIVAWYRHLLAGQEGKLPMTSLFCFSRVDNHDSSVAKCYDSLPSERPFICTLTWGPDEKLYAIHLNKTTAPNGPTSSFNGLPLARSELIYVPFHNELVETLSEVGGSKVSLGRLLRLVLACENLGPVHAIDAHLFERLNAHLPSRLPQALLEDFASNQWVKEDLYDEEAIEWAELSLATLLSWLKSPHNPFWHAQSSTWRCGPNGIRWIAALIAHLATSFTMIDNGEDVPAAIQRRLNSQEHRRNWRLLSQATEWLIKSLEACKRTLAETFPARVEAWKSEVISQYLNFQVSSDDDQPPSHAVTNGVPRSMTELRQVYDILTRTDSDKTLGSDSEEVYVPRKRALRASRRTRIQSPIESSTPTASEASDNDIADPGQRSIARNSSKRTEVHEEDTEDSDSEYDSAEERSIAADDSSADVLEFAEATFRIREDSETQSLYSDRGMTSTQHADVLADLSTSTGSLAFPRLNRSVSAASIQEPSPTESSASIRIEESRMLRDIVSSVDPPPLPASGGRAMDIHQSSPSEIVDEPPTLTETGGAQKPSQDSQAGPVPALRRSPRKPALSARAMGAIQSSRKGTYRRGSDA